MAHRKHRRSLLPNFLLRLSLMPSKLRLHWRLDDSADHARFHADGQSLIVHVRLFQSKSIEKKYEIASWGDFGFLQKNCRVCVYIGNAMVLIGLCHASQVAISSPPIGGDGNPLQKKTAASKKAAVLLFLIFLVEVVDQCEGMRAGAISGRSCLHDNIGGNVRNGATTRGRNASLSWGRTLTAAYRNSYAACQQ